MLQKIKRIFKVIKTTIIVLTMLIGLVVGVCKTIYVSYTAGQISACNAMLRQDPNTRRFGLYCEPMLEGIVVRSTKLKKSLFNITTNETYFR